MSGTSWNVSRCEERLRSIWQLSLDKQQSTLFARLEIRSRFQSQAVLHWLSGGLCHARKCQFKDWPRKGMICVCPMDVCTRNLCRERQNGERKPVLILVPGTHKCLTLRKHVMCARNFGAHVRRSIWSMKGKNGMRNHRSPAQPRKVQRN